MNRHLGAVLIAVGAAFLFSACVAGTNPACSASTCNGCCDASGKCQVGSAATACGNAGAACTSCTGAQTCSTSGTCEGSGACSAASCNGCCAGNGACISPSNTVAACGANGGACQVCSGTQVCDTGGACSNTANCNGCVDSTGACQIGTGAGECGANGSACHACGEGQACANGQCTGTCTPNCSGKQCGSDGCNGSCGSCAQGDSCSASGQCVAGCTPQCSGKQCGSDGCGGSCGTCSGGNSCNGSGQCVSGGGGSVGNNGGSVPSLYFAVIGDTRPANEDDTANYPTAIITKIFQDMNAMNPKPQFIIGTGDYQYANPANNQGAAQIALYMQAESNWTGGPVFHAMGNHECNGYTTSNMDLSNNTCDGAASANYTAYYQNMVQPLGKTLPYYTIPINATDGSWTSKFIIVACNAWDSTQQTWLQTQLGQATTYTFVIRHEDPSANTGPCVTQMDSMLSSAKYDALIVGHSHTFENDYASGKFIIVGNGGAGSGGSYGYGYATFQQNGSSFTVTDYDYSTAAPATTFTIQ